MTREEQEKWLTTIGGFIAKQVVERTVNLELRIAGFEARIKELESKSSQRALKVVARKDTA